MTFGKVKLFCPCCGTIFVLGEKIGITYHGKAWGHLCSKECYDIMEMRYAMMILGKDSI